RPGGGLRRGVARQGHLTALGEAGLAAVEQRGRAPVAVDLGARGRGDRDGGAGGAHRDAGVGGGRGGQREGERGGGCRGRGGAEQGHGVAHRGLPSGGTVRSEERRGREGAGIA